MRDVPIIARGRMTPRTRKMLVDPSTDYDIRAAIVREMLRDGVPRCDIRHEITLDTSSSGGRADVMLLRDNALIGVEVKSGRDKLDRLHGQVEAMKRAFDYVVALVDASHASDKHKVAYESIGCTDVKLWHQERGFLFTWGEPMERQWLRFWETLERHNKSRETGVVGVSRLLWKSEADYVTAALKLPKQTRERSLRLFQERIALSQLRPLVIAQLRLRPLNKWEDAFWARFDATEAMPKRAKGRAA